MISSKRAGSDTPRTIEVRHQCSQRNDRRRQSRPGRPWLGQLGDRLLVGADRVFEAVAEGRADHAKSLDDQTRARSQTHELIIHAQLGEPLLAAANQKESLQIAAVRLENRRLKVFDHALLLQAPVVSERLAENLLREHAAVVLSLVAHAGTRPDAAGPRAGALQSAMQAGADAMGDITLRQHHQLSMGQADAALAALKQLAPLEKAFLIRGLFAAVTADGVIRVAEAELMRLVGAVLDCPLPPLLDEMDPAALAT